MLNTYLLERSVLRINQIYMDSFHSKSTTYSINLKVRRRHVTFSEYLIILSFYGAVQNGHLTAFRFPPPALPHLILSPTSESFHEKSCFVGASKIADPPHRLGRPF